MNPGQKEKTLSFILKHIAIIRMFVWRNTHHHCHHHHLKLSLLSYLLPSTKSKAINDLPCPLPEKFNLSKTLGKWGRHPQQRRGWWSSALSQELSQGKGLCGAILRVRAQGTAAVSGTYIPEVLSKQANTRGSWGPDHHRDDKRTWRWDPPCEQRL